MQAIANTGTKAQALILGVVVVGCATAATITGHLTGNDLLVVLTGAVGAGGAVTAAHVGGTTATNAITSSAATQPAPVAAPSGGAVADGTGTAPAPSPVAAVDQAGVVTGVSAQVPGVTV